MIVPQLDPDAAERVASFGDVPPMRERGLDAIRRAIESAPLPETMPKMASVEDCTAPGPAGPVPLRIYRPTDETEAPALLYFHGGGMVMGSNHSFEPLARMLAAASNSAVVAVDYRLAPENPPPAQFDDAYVATTWISDNAVRLGFDEARIAVAGDSAGGSLAAAVALAARDHGGPMILCQLLMYPGLDRDLRAPSIKALADAPMLSLDDK